MFGGRENLRGLDFLLGTAVFLEHSICSLLKAKVKMSVSREETLIIVGFPLLLGSGLVSGFEFCLETFFSLAEVVVSPHLEVLVVSMGWIQGIDTFRLLVFTVPVFLSCPPALSP